MNTHSTRQPSVLQRRTCAALIASLWIAVFALPAPLAAASAEPEPGASASIFWSLYPGIGRLHMQVQGDQAPQGLIVEAVRISGNVSLDIDTIKFYLSTREGAPFDWTTAQLDFRALLNSNFFDDLTMRWEPGTSGGVVIILEVEERPLLRQVRIEGSDKVGQDELLERMEDLEMPVEIDRPIDRPAMRRAGDVLTTMLQGDEGLQFVQVAYSTQPSTLGAGVDAVYDVVEGDTVRIESVYFEGVTEFTQQEMRWMVKKTSEHWLFSFLTKNDRFSPSGFELDHFLIGNEYRRLGYLDIQIGDPVIEVYDIDQPWPFDDKRRLYVTIPIEEGPQYHLRDILFEGNTRFTDAQLTSLVPIFPGDVIDVKGVIDAKDAMESIYSNVGYFQIQVGPVPDPDPETGLADIIFTVNENALYTIRRIEFEGNTNTRDYVMRRNLLVHENDLWSQAAVNASKFKIQQLGYFDNIEEEVTVVQDPGNVQTPAPGEMLSVTDPVGPVVQEPGVVDIKMKVSEVGRNQISFGGGISALEGAFVQFGYSTRNLFGRGQTVSFSGQFGGRRTNARVSFSQPHLFDSRVIFGLDFFRDSLDFFDFQRSGSGMSARVGFPLDRAEYTRLFLEYNYEFIDIGDVSFGFGGLSDPLFNALFLQEGKRTTSSFRPFLQYNSIDSPFNPSRGRRSTVSFEMAGGPLGGSLDFFKSILSTTWYIPTKREGRGVGAQVKQIFAFNVDLRFAEPYGDLVLLPIFERFFLGGSNSVRGTRLRSISPVDQFGNIIGGSRALQYNIEYIFQLAGPVRVAAFTDGGAAWDDAIALPLDDLRKTAGFEFRIFMPVFNVPFRFFWAYNFDPLPQFGEERSTFEFAIGTTF